MSPSPRVCTCIRTGVFSPAGDVAVCDVVLTRVPRQTDRSDVLAVFHVDVEPQHGDIVAPVVAHAHVARVHDHLQFNNTATTMIYSSARLTYEERLCRLKSPGGVNKHQFIYLLIYLETRRWSLDLSFEEIERYLLSIL